MAWEPSVVQVYVDNSLNVHAKFRCPVSHELLHDLGSIEVNSGDKREIHNIQFQGRRGTLTVIIKYKLLDRLVIFAVFNAYEFTYEFPIRELLKDQSRFIGPFMVWKVRRDILR